MKFEFRVTETTDEEVRAKILAPLRSYNTSKAGETGQRGLVVEIVSDEGATIGGLWGTTSWQWLFVQLLVVPNEFRGQGVGTRMMAMAEAEAVRRGCHSAWLDTFEFQARPFYEALGYSCYGELKDYPPGFSRFFMQKSLVADAAREAFPIVRADSLHLAAPGLHFILGLAQPNEVSRSTQTLGLTIGTYGRPH